MKNDKSQFVVRTSDFYLSLFICHLSSVISRKNPLEEKGGSAYSVVKEDF